MIEESIKINYEIYDMIELEEKLTLRLQRLNEIKEATQPQ